jgi:hypothetical protein
MPVTVHCRFCGFLGASTGIGIAPRHSRHYHKQRDGLPRRGRAAAIEDGTYDFLGRVVTAVRARWITPEDIVALQALAPAVQSVETNPQATGRSEKEILP